MLCRRYLFFQVRSQIEIFVIEKCPKGHLKSDRQLKTGSRWVLSKIFSPILFIFFFYKPVKISRIRKLTTWKINCPMRVQPQKRLSALDAEHFDLSAEIWPGEFDISWEKNTNIQYLAFINVRIRVKVIWEPLSLIDIV